MGRLVIYGGSDDLIEVAGDIREEFTAMSDEKGYVACDGALIRYRLEEVWEFLPVAYRGVEVTVVPARDLNDSGMPDDEDGCPGYSQKVVIVSDREKFGWVLHGTEVAR